VLLYNVPTQFITVSYDYYANGQVKSVIDNEGRTTLTAYDADGSVTREDVYTDATHQNTTEYVNNYFGKAVLKKVHVHAGDLTGNDYNSTTDTTLITEYA
jgi:YD repeat-containing protein